MKKLCALSRIKFFSQQDDTKNANFDSVAAFLMHCHFQDLHFYLKSHNLRTEDLPFCPNLAKEASDKSDISRKRAKCVCHLHWPQWNIMMSYLTYLLVGWVFLHEIWPGRRAHYVNYENINNSNLDGMSLASFCQSRAALFGFPRVKCLLLLCKAKPAGIKGCLHYVILHRYNLRYIYSKKSSLPPTWLFIENE